MVVLPPSRPGVDFVAEFWCANQVQDVYYFRRLMAQGCRPSHLLFTVSLENNRTWRGRKENDVWSGRASQEVLIDLSACSPVSMYPAHDDPLCPQPDTLRMKARSANFDKCGASLF
jgi:hypothetical protein